MKVSYKAVFGVVALLALAACGGGGGSSSTSTSTSGSGTSSSSSAPSTSQTASSANVSPAAYASGSITAAMFSTINTARTTCGFNSLTENTTLDTAAANHASYMLQNGGLVTDTEVSGNAGFTGAAYADRATAAGYPSSVYVGGESAAYYTNASLSGTQYGTNIADEWLTGVYHVAVAIWPLNEIGLGVGQTTWQGYPNILASNTTANLTSTPGNLPLTYPCQGVTGVPYEEAGESPTPLNVNGAFGTPIGVAGNPSDTVTLSSGTATDTSGNVVTLQVLNSSSDPNKLLPAFEAVAYPTSPLKANTTYSVSLSGTYNGAAFSRTFSFTTGNTVA